MDRRHVHHVRQGKPHYSLEQHSAMVSMAIYTEECLWREKKNESACMEDPNTEKVEKNAIY